jgi:cytochrome P450
MSKLPPGPPKSLSNTIKWVRRPDVVMDAAHKQFGDVWMLRMHKAFGGGATFVLVSDPELIKDVFTADPAVLRGGEANKMIGTALLGEHSVILLDDSEHTTQRKLLLPLFHAERVQRYREVMERICEQELASWPLREPFRLLPRMQSITLHAIMSAIFGVTEGTAQEPLRARIRDLEEFAASEMRMAMMHVAGRIGWLPRSFLKVREPLDAVIFEEIDRARRDPRLDERDDILAMLLRACYDDGSAMSDRALRDQMVTLLMQGHMSTATALAWAFERLIRHPEMLERLRAEAESESEDYLDAVVTETLRVRPPVGLCMRLVKQPFQLGEYELEPGMLVAPCIYLLHRREDLYSEPERFRPERFLRQQPGPYTWIPFGGGDRHCIGRSFATLEIKVVLRALALQARFGPAEQGDEQVTRAGVMFSPNRGAQVALLERVPPVAAPSAAPS